MSSIVKDKPVHIIYKTYKSKNSKLDNKKTKHAIKPKLVQSYKPKGARIVIRLLTKLLINLKNLKEEDARDEVVRALFGIDASQKLELNLKGVAPLEEDDVVNNLKCLGLNEKHILENYLPFKWDIIVFVKHINSV